VAGHKGAPGATDGQAGRANAPQRPQRPHPLAACKPAIPPLMARPPPDPLACRWLATFSLVRPSTRIICAGGAACVGWGALSPRATKGRQA
jgi:hypothetical protein